MRILGMSKEVDACDLRRDNFRWVRSIGGYQVDLGLKLYLGG